MSLNKIVYERWAGNSPSFYLAVTAESNGYAVFVRRQDCLNRLCVAFFENLEAGRCARDRAIDWAVQLADTEVEDAWQKRVAAFANRQEALL